jgi:DNA invertase Pin-like site-specific DNA recombinase
MRKVLFAFSEYERNLIKARSAAGMKRKKANGGYVGGGIPYGWRIDHRSLVENPSEMAAIAQARTMRRLGATLDTIGEFFASWGVRLRRGKEWRRATVRGVINRANTDNYPPPAELSNMARAFMNLPLDPDAE